jgi:hypothetical protein
VSEVQILPGALLKHLQMQEKEEPQFLAGALLTPL